MSKLEFINKLRNSLSVLPEEDIEERIAFYSEIIDDKTDEGLSEEEAIREIGSVEEIVSGIIADIPLSRIVKEKIKPRRSLSALEILLIVLGIPVWFPLISAVGAVILALYVAIWSVIISLWAIFVSLIGCTIGGIVAGIVLICYGNILAAIAMLCGGIFCAGLSIFAFFGCKAATKGIFILTKKILLGIKNLFFKKGAVSNE